MEVNRTATDPLSTKPAEDLTDEECRALAYVMLLMYIRHDHRIATIFCSPEALSRLVQLMDSELAAGGYLITPHTEEEAN